MQNLLEMRPVRLHRYRMSGDGSKLTVLVPKFGRHAVGRFLNKLIKNHFFSVRLDEFGSFVWERCDGEKQVKDIAKGLSEEFGEKVEPVNDRLALFLKQMEKAKLISFREISKVNLTPTSLER